MNNSFKKIMKIYNKTKGKCWYCGIELDYMNRTAKNGFQVEHANSRSNDIDNLLPSCSKCNREKASKNVEEFRYWISDKYDLNSHQIKKLTDKFGSEFVEKISDALYYVPTFYGETLNDKGGYKGENNE